MSLELRQTAKPVPGAGQWSWSVWLEGPEEELDAVQRVRYQLHHTFPEPVRDVADRQTKFRLDSSGWGEFAVYAMVLRKDGSETRLQHWLRLEEPGDAPSAGQPKPPTVFISSGVADADMAQGLAASLKRHGLRVLSAEDMQAHAGVKDAIRDQIDQAEIGLVVISDAPGPWVAQEASLLQETNALVVPIVTSGKRRSPLQHPSPFEALARDPAALRVAPKEGPQHIVDRLLRHPALSRWNLSASDKA